MFDIFDSSLQATVSYTDNSINLFVPAMGYTREQCEVSVQSGKMFLKLKNEKRGTSTWSYYLPKTVDVEKISAKLELGELALTLPLIKQEIKIINIE
jgi:HSP20 family molecular chaperone IbpA